MVDFNNLHNPYGVSANQTNEKLTAQDVEDYLGEPDKIDGRHWYYQCPDCGDTGMDNLIFTPDKGILKSFCCDSCRQLYGEIMDYKRDKTRGKRIMLSRKNKTKTTNTTVTRDIPKLKKRAKILSQAQQKWSQNLLRWDKALDYLYEKRGLTKETIELVGLGVKQCKNGTKAFSLPVYDYIEDEPIIIGFEYRYIKLNKKFVWKQKGTYSCLAKINDRTDEAEILVIMEGFWDAYCLWQYLREQKQDKYYEIRTPSNGVQGVLGCMATINFEQYKKVVLYLDSDDIGILAMQKIQEKYPFVEKIIMSCGCKDFNEHYLKCIKGSEVKVAAAEEEEN